MTFTISIFANPIVACICAAQSGTLLGTVSDGSCPQCVDGLYRVDTETGLLDLIDEFFSSVSVGGMTVAPDGTVFASSITFERLVLVDPMTATVQDVGPLPGPQICGLSFAPDGILYGFNDETNELIIIDPATADSTSVGPTEFITGGDLAFSPDGTLYAVGSNASTLYAGLWTIDVSTGTATFIGLLGSDTTGDLIILADGLAFIGDKLYASCQTDSDARSSLYEVDTETGTATLIGDFDPDFNGIYAGSLAFFPGLGDADRDGDADLDDFARFQACFTGPELDEPGEPDDPPLPVECQFLDTDKDRDIDLIDFASFQNGFTGPNEE